MNERSCATRSGFQVTVGDETVVGATGVVDEVIIDGIVMGKVASHAIAAGPFWTGGAKAVQPGRWPISSRRQRGARACGRDHQAAVRRKAAVSLTFSHPDPAHWGRILSLLRENRRRGSKCHDSIRLPRVLTL
jgi:hypothetical protein